MLNVKKLALIIATVAVTACTGSSGDKFVGKWIKAMLIKVHRCRFSNVIRR